MAFSSNKSALRGVNLNNYSNRNVNKNNIVIARVLDACIDETSNLFNSNGEYNSIGSIRAEALDISDYSFTVMARPYFTFIKYIPLVGETVLLVQLPAYNAAATSGDSYDYYYLPTINIWNNQHYNPIIEDESKKTQSKSNINEIKLGFPNKNQGLFPATVEPNPSNHDSFVEKDIRQLKTFPGDLVFEGRFGNSIRLGNTSRAGNTVNAPRNSTTRPNPWSSKGDNSDPITIISNGYSPLYQKYADFEPYMEDPRIDITSIYMTSTQSLPINAPTPNFTSTKKKPLALSDYAGPQLLFNSDRITLTAKNDSILLNSKETINLAAKEIGLSSDEIVLQGTVRLGNRFANQPIMRGRDTVDLIEDLLIALKSAFTKLQDSKNWPEGLPSTDTSAIDASIDMVKQIEYIESTYLGPSPRILSTITNTI